MAPNGDSGPVCYEDGDAVVFCDRSNPNAWLRSDTVVTVGDSERDRLRPERA